MRQPWVCNAAYSLRDPAPLSEVTQSTRFQLKQQCSFLCSKHLYDLSLDSFFSLQVPVRSWFDDMEDMELLELLPFFEGLSKEEDVYAVLENWRGR